MSRAIPAPVRRAVATKYGLEPGKSKVIPCHYDCGATTRAYWPLGVRGKPSYWPMFGPGFGLDHVIPWSKGGEHDPDNLVVCCGRCNTSKLDRPAPVNRGTTAEPFRNHSAVDARPVHGSPVSGRGREGIRKGREEEVLYPRPIPIRPVSDAPSPERWGWAC